jgi:hypothetical protein
MPIRTARPVILDNKHPLLDSAAVFLIDLLPSSFQKARTACTAATELRCYG